MTELIITSSNPGFPPELIDSIFSFLQVDDEGVDYFDEGVATLKRCSMDPVLCQFAEKHFYSTITVRNSVVSNPGVFNADALAELFSDQPHLAHHVRNMRIILSYYPRPCLDDILSRVSRLECIVLSLKETVYIPWRSLPESFRAAFVARIKSPMKKVVLEHHLEFPLSVLDNCTIENLIFRDIRLGIEPHSTLLHDINPSPSPVLDSLTLDCVKTFGSQFEVWGKSHFHTLRSLTVSPWESDITIMFSMMLSILFPLCSNTLTSLHIDLLRTCLTSYDVSNCTTTPPAGSFRFSLSTLPHLQQLTICGDIVLDHKRISTYNYVYLKNYSPLPAICQVLANSPPSLTHLTLHLRIRFRADCSPSVLSTIDWQPLVNVLNSSTLSVKQTHLHVFVGNAYNHPQLIHLDQITPTLRKSVDLSRLVEQGTLVIHGHHDI